MTSMPTRTQVLVVGAGPVGLMAALRLQEQGIDVRIIDQQSEHGIHTFPVVLHPLTLRLLGSLGLTEALFWICRELLGLLRARSRCRKTSCVRRSATCCKAAASASSGTRG